MTARAAALAERAAELRRRRFPAYLLRSFPWYRRLGEEDRYRVEERVGMVCGNGPCSAEAFLLALGDIERPMVWNK